MNTKECHVIISKTVEIINEQFNQLNPPEYFKVCGYEI